MGHVRLVGLETPPFSIQTPQTGLHNWWPIMRENRPETHKRALFQKFVAGAGSTSLIQLPTKRLPRGLARGCVLKKGTVVRWELFRALRARRRLFD